MMLLLLMIPLLGTAAAFAAEVPAGERVKLGTTPERIVAMCPSQNDVERTKVAEVFGGTPYSCRVTYWQLDGDAYREAILEAAGGGATVYVFLDQDAEGWWKAGTGSVSLRGSAGFRVMNWPDHRGPRSVIVEGAVRYGTELYVQGITVFRLDKGRLTEVLESELHGSSMAMG